MNHATQAHDDGLDALIGDADLPMPQIPSAAEVMARATRADMQLRAARGSSRPVDSGKAVHPQLRVGPGSRKPH